MSMDTLLRAVNMAMLSAAAEASPKKMFCPKLLFGGRENLLSLGSVQDFDFFQVF